jgi:HK97 family phage major capsid protein
MPKSIVGSTSFAGRSNQIKRSALLYSNPSVYNLYLQQITQKQLLGIDEAVLYGTGTAPQPSGVLHNTRLQSFQFGGSATVVAPNIADLTTMARLLEGTAAPEDNRGWIMNPCLKLTLMATLKFPAAPNSTTILEEGDSTLLSHPITTGPQIPIVTADSSTDLWFGDFGMCGVCLFAGGTATILPNPYGSQYASGGTELAIFQDVAAGTARASSWRATARA